MSAPIESLSESDTRAKLITPALHRRGWREDMIRREQTAGAIEKIGDAARRRPKRTDYVLRTPVDGAQPVAVALIEAKRTAESPGRGMEQAKICARRMHVPFVYSSNGHLFVEYDAASGTQFMPKPMDCFPSPEELRRRYEKHVGFNLQENSARPLSVPYCGGEGGRRYYQDAAIRAALEKIVRDQKAGEPPRMMLHLATGAGKTYIAAHLLKRLDDAGQMKRALFLCDRDALRAQALSYFQKVFGGDVEEARRDADGENRARNARVHIATYQTLGADSDQRESAADSFGEEHYPENHFSHIVIDECHRSAWHSWSGILRRNANAVHIGLTATPRGLAERDNSEDHQKIIADNYRYFGEPVYSYGLAQGAEDGYLALCEIRKAAINLDITGIPIDELLAHKPTDYRTGEPLTREQLLDIYEKKDYENILMLPDRVEAMCRDLFEHLAAAGDPLQKTIVFCTRREHAEMVAAKLGNLYEAWRRKNGGSATNSYAFVCMSETGGDLLPEFRSEDRDYAAAATVDLLSTGVDIPKIRHIAFFRYLRSPIILHQMIGRGARIHEPSGKLSFTVHDYTNATDHLGEDEWKIRKPTPGGERRPPTPPPTLATADGFEVRISDGGSYIVVQDRDGSPLRMSAKDYRRWISQRLLQRVHSLDELREIWTDTPQRRQLLDFLREEQSSPKALAALLQTTDCDDYDILAESGFGALPLSRQRRAEDFSHKNKEWLQEFPAEGAEVLRALARRFAADGIAELENPEVFDTPEVAKAGGLAALRKIGEPSDLLAETKKRLLAA